jgi:hypothetical protein
MIFKNIFVFSIFIAVLAIMSSSLKQLSGESTSDFFIHIETVENIELTEMSFEEDHTDSYANKIIFTYSGFKNRFNSNFSGNTSVNPFVPDIPPEQC